MRSGKALPKLIGFVILFFVLGAALALLPRAAAQHGVAMGNACLNQVERGDAQRSPHQCLAEAERWLWVPLHLPVHQASHASDTDELRARADRLELIEAVQRTPDAKRRDAAARSLVERGGSLQLLADAGAHAELARAAARPESFSGSDEALDEAIDAALFVADLESAKRLASANRTGGDWQRRGALACLLGEREAGLRVLGAERPEEVHLEYSSATWPGSAILACGGSLRKKSWTPTPALLSLYGRGPATPRLGKDELPRRAENAEHVALVPFAIDAAREPEAVVTLAAFFSRPSLSELLRALAVDVHCVIRRCAIAEPISPWSLLELNDDPLGFLPVTRLEAAAERLEKRALALPEKDTPPDELSCEKCSPDELKQLHGALSAPRSTVLRLASQLRFVAAVEWARRGRTADAKRAAAHGERLAPPTDGRDVAVRASTHWLGRDTSAALAPLDRYVAPYPGDEAVVRSLALASLDRHVEAFTHAQKSGSVDSIWIANALGLMLHREAQVLAPPEGATNPYTPPPQQWTDSSRWWSRLARLPDPERKAARAAILLETDPPSKRLARFRVSYAQALPAVLYLIGYVARDADAEAWLDRVIGAPRDRARKMMLARSEAARWRGDHAAAKLWETRAARLAALISDDRSAVLATFAGL